MPSAESSRAKSRRTAASPPAKVARQQRLLRELQIDGTAALKGEPVDFPASKPGKIQKHRGASYELADDGLSWATTTSKKRPAPITAPPLPPPAERSRSSTEAVQTSEPAAATRTSKKRKREEESPAADAEFLSETVRLHKAAKYSDGASGQAELSTLLPFLRRLQQPRRQHIRRQAPGVGAERGEAADAYELSEQEARLFLQGTEAIDAPLFLTGQRIGLLDLENDARRPIEQIFDWLSNDDEQHTVSDLLAEQIDGHTPDKDVTIAEIRERFLNPFPVDAAARRDRQLSPWNLPEITWPTVCETMPSFLRHPSCNVVRDLLRYLAEVEPEDICHKTCPNASTTAEHCDKHFLGAAEWITLQQVYRHFLGTVMLSEAGGFTGAHFDTFGFGTYVCCVEGEIGFAWCADVMARRKRGPSARDRWLFKVLRAGDAVYMDPGRYHLVFRRPGGTQTMGWATRVLRYCDVEVWLRIILLEIQEAAAGRVSNEDYLLIWRGLLISADRSIQQAKRTSKFEKFGGEEAMLAAEKVLKRAEKELKKLL